MKWFTVQLGRRVQGPPHPPGQTVDRGVLIVSTGPFMRGHTGLIRVAPSGYILARSTGPSGSAGRFGLAQPVAGTVKAVWAPLKQMVDGVLMVYPISQARDAVIQRRAFRLTVNLNVSALKQAVSGTTLMMMMTLPRQADAVVLASAVGCLPPMPSCGTCPFGLWALLSVLLSMKPYPYKMGVR